MIRVDEALAKILALAQPRPATRVPLPAALGRVLAEDVTSDIDSPPHDKALMDGYAVIASDIDGPEVRLRVVEEVTAGEVPSRPVHSGEATRIMTGAPIPKGADAVVMVEQTKAAGDGNAIECQTTTATIGQNIMPRGTSLRAGQVVLQAGQTIRPIEIGVLAECGADEVAVFPTPTAAVLSTGNELVPVSELPDTGQIRNSNGPMLGALVCRAGSQPVDLGIGRDDRSELMDRVQRGLREDVLILSGGVSAGVMDLVPGVLRENGVEEVFHKVKLKPGKPLWFGTRRSAAATTLVFGLPGNPVSSLVCFELFVRPALRALAGHGDGGLPRRRARLTSAFQHRGDRPTYFPSRLVEEQGGWLAEPLPWKGSADLRTLADANGLIHFPPGKRTYSPGDIVEVCVFQ